MNNWLQNNKHMVLPLLGALITGALLSWIVLSIFSNNNDGGEKKPLYWVAPMDPNYRRDTPGKSPMGMDLIPVYEEDGASENSAGVVRINPSIANNLGLRTAQVKRGAIQLNIRTVGYISFDEEQLTHFHSRVDGWIEKLAVTAVGDPVKKGQKLFELYSPQLVTAQDEYVAALTSGSNALLKAAERKLDALGVNAGQIDTLRRTRKVKQRLDFYADYDSYVADLNVREGMFIKPATTIVSLGGLDTVWIIAEIFERQADWIRAGQPVDMTVTSFPDQTWQGVVDYVYPVLDVKTRTLRARIKFDNPEHRLKPNMFAELVIQASQRDDTLSIPREALIRDGRMSRVVKVMGDGEYKSVRVRTGIESENTVEILKGLSDGDRIVTSAQFLLDSESSVTADLGRIENEEPEHVDEKPQTVWTEGVIQSLMPDHRMAKIKHAPVPEWQWPTMTMDFFFEEGVPLDDLTNGESIRFRLKRLENGKVLIIDVNASKQNVSIEAANQVTDTDTMPASHQHSEHGVHHPSSTMQADDHSEHAMHAPMDDQSGVQPKHTTKEGHHHD